MPPSHTVKGVGDAKDRDRLLIGCLESGATDYSTTTGIDISTNDFWPDQHFNAIRLTEGSGNIAIEMPNSGVMVLPFTVGAGVNEEHMRGYSMQKILKSALGTTFNGHIFPIF